MEAFMTNRGRREGGFTLSELLVVLAIIVVLLALLLPALRRVRRAAESVMCLGRLRQIGAAMRMYAAENRGAIAGSGLTTGRHLWTVEGNRCVAAHGYTIFDCPLVNEPCDFIGPLAREMNIGAPELWGNDGVARYRLYRRLKVFQCPSYGEVESRADPSGQADAGPGAALGYNTALAFLNVAWSRYPYPADNGFAGNVTIPTPLYDATGQARHGPFWCAPAGYFPNVAKVGNPAEKIYAADGARRSIYARPPDAAVVLGPVYVLSCDPPMVKWSDTMFSDYGAFGGLSQSYNRGAVPGNSDAGDEYVQDARLMAYRHGTDRPFQPAGMYRMNAVFYDGHAESLDDLSASNPALWLPKGSVLWNPASGASGTSRRGWKVVWSDYQQTFLGGEWGLGHPYVVP
jgi:prepilin-type N-terminal cleavage/methylation domain-containing protein